VVLSRSAGGRRLSRRSQPEAAFMRTTIVAAVSLVCVLAFTPRAFAQG
jgi:hypothetical protein